MSKIIARDQAAAQAKIHLILPEVQKQPHLVDRTFELPHRFYATTVALFLGFLAVMALGLPSSGLLIPMVIFAIFIIGFFGVPAVWVRMKPEENTSRSLRWQAFQKEGISTYTGRVSARDASVQVLILPVLIFAWGVAIVTIKAIVS